MGELVDTRDDNGIRIVTIDNPPINALSQNVREALARVLTHAGRDDGVVALILRCSGRTFVAGADIREFDGTEILAPDPNELHALLESMRVPVVAALHGTVLGGGLELALACHYRIALASTRLGLPEVTLGVLPGGGGTQRLPRLVGMVDALDMIVTGKPVSALRALRIGLVDAVVDGELEAHARAWARRAANEDIAARVLRRRVVALEPLASRSIGQWKDRLPPEDRGGHAGRVCVEVVRNAAELPFDEGLARERAAFMACKETEASKALRHAFFSERAASRIPDLPDRHPQRNIASVGIVGAGAMGVGIAMSFASAGIPVVLLDRNADTLNRAAGTIRTTYDTAVRKGRVGARDADWFRNLIDTDSGDVRLAQCDLVIEAVDENLEIKERVFTRLGQVAKPGALLASNTSSLDVNRLAECSNRPADVLGMHFFSPAHVMRLLEVVRADATAPDVLATAMHLARRIGKIPVVSGVCFGFIGNRMLEGYLRETEFLLLEGASPAFIDRALEQFGMAMGPCRMVDMAGLDVAAKVVFERGKAGMLPPDPAYRPVVRRLYDMGRFGQKAGSGYYLYDDRNPVEDAGLTPVFEALARMHGIRKRDDITDGEVVERCLCAMISEGYRILEEGIAYRPGDIDVVWIHGFGFPAYRGGPMFHGKSVGERQLAERMDRLAATRGNDFGYWTVPQSLRKAGRSADA